MLGKSPPRNLDTCVSMTDLKVLTSPVARAMPGKEIKVSLPQDPNQGNPASTSVFFSFLMMNCCAEFNKQFLKLSLGILFEYSDCHLRFKLAGEFSLVDPEKIISSPKAIGNSKYPGT